MVRYPNYPPEVVQACQDLIQYASNTQDKRYTKAFDIVYQHLIVVKVEQFFKQNRTEGLEEKDVSQKVAIQMMGKKIGSKYRPEQNPVPIVIGYIKIIIRNLWIDCLRKKNRRNEDLQETQSDLPSEMQVKLPWVHGAEEHYMAIETKDTISRMTEEMQKRMNEKQYELYLMDTSSNSIPDAQKAGILGVSIDNLYQIRRRYRKIVQMYLQENGIDFNF